MTHCFYCQVEQVRLGLDPEQPMAVQQWQGLIAVNYPARRIGLSKQSNVPDALKLCPDIRLVHVATYAGDGQPAAYHDQPKRQTHKVSLEPYRQASDRIIKILKTFTPEIQKASIGRCHTNDNSNIMDQLK
ncbi:hypothetical protein BDF22DRAFT_699481 [Syncephalis plumigaleata]|nr:hypothetical protein BDF22DRAFT_699481 [Syncephalis plumigaleata]